MVGPLTGDNFGSLIPVPAVIPAGLPPKPVLRRSEGMAARPRPRPWQLGHRQRCAGCVAVLRFEAVFRALNRALQFFRLGNGPRPARARHLHRLARGKAPRKGCYIRRRISPSSALDRPSEISRAVSCSRREFLRTITGAGLAPAFGSLAPRRAWATTRRRKMVVVTFGGGARDEETFMAEGQENIPHLLAELLPQATFFTQVVNRGILGHYVATASLATGVYETFDNFTAVPPDNPTVFEYFRKDLRRPVTDAWVVAPSNGFNRIGASRHASYGSEFGAGVILPKRLLKAALSSGRESSFEHLLRDNYENVLYAPELSSSELELRTIDQILNLSVADFTAHARCLASPDELSVYVMRQLMRRLAPSLLWITLHDIDIAHTGAYSLYIDGIRRSDRLCAEICKTIESEPEYAGKTTMFILPDFGRDSDIDSGGNGFQHHRTGDPLSRTTWMMVMGPGIRENAVVDRPVESLDLVPTLGAMLGFSPARAAGKPLGELV